MPCEDAEKGERRCLDPGRRNQVDDEREVTVNEGCWCWQYGRCLTDCPTADLPRPPILTTAVWLPAYEAVMAAKRASENT